MGTRRMGFFDNPECWSEKSQKATYHSPGLYAGYEIVETSQMFIMEVRKGNWSKTKLRARVAVDLRTAKELRDVLAEFIRKAEA